MTGGERVLRVVIGFVIVALVVFVGIRVVQQVIPTWGATPDEVARTLPGDELYANPSVNWTHAITINAPAERVWQWIAQIGERRAAFYSFTFIENQMGNGDVYHNADRIVPEWQNPTPGTPLIGGGLPLNVSQVEPGKWMVASSGGDLGWSWVWYLEPLNADQTRLQVRMKIQPGGATSNPIIDTVIGLGAFVMEQGMLQGLEARAEGNIPPAYSEALEIALWVLALVGGVIAGVLFVVFKEWLFPLMAGLLAIIAVFAFTFLQPPIAGRLIIDVLLYALLAGIVITLLRERSAQPISHDHTGAMTLKPHA